MRHFVLYLWHHHGIEPALSPELGLRFAQPVERHRPYQRTSMSNRQRFRSGPRIDRQDSLPRALQQRAFWLRSEVDGMMPA